MPMRTAPGFVAYIANAGDGIPAILKGAQGEVYSANDISLSAPLTCRDIATEEVIPAPVSNKDGYIPGFKVSISDTAAGVIWKSGEYAVFQPFLGVPGKDGSNVLPTDEAIAQALNTVDSDTQAAADARYAKRGELVVSPHDYGAVGDGYTVEDAAFQAAADAIRDAGGGVMQLRPGFSYNLNSSIQLYSNTLVNQLGAEVIKRASRSSYSAYVTRSDGLLGYGSGGRNIRVVGGVMRGSYMGGLTGISVTMHHAEDIVFDSVRFTESVMTGHSIDLGGCKGVHIYRCTFEGWSIQTGREYTEAIQLDFSTALGMGIETASNAYDGLPTVDVTVEQCRFIPLNLGGQTFPAPNPLGNHNRVEGQILDGIRFIDNYVEDGRPTADLVSGAAEYFGGWVHLFCASDVLIRGNTFVTHNTGLGTNVIRARTPSTGTLLADVNTSNPDSQTIPLAAPTGFRITGNKFIGFKATSSTMTPLAQIMGAATAKVSALIWRDNEFTDCTPGTGTAFAAGAQYGLYASDVTTLNVSGIVADGMGSLVRAYRCGNVVLSGILGKRITNQLVDFDDCASVKFNGVDATYAGGAYFRNVRSIKFAATELRTFYETTGVATSGEGLVVLSGCKNISLDGATYSNASGNTFVKQAVWIYGTSVAGRVKDSIIIGSFTNAPINISSNSPTVVESGTLMGAV